MAEPIDHDRLFKELLETFFADFVELFFPQVYAEMDLGQINFLQQEVFTDVTRGDKHRVDILAETRLKGEPGIVLVHVENQAQPQAGFAERMFVYFSRLYQRYRCRILPIAVFSYPEKRDEADLFQVEFPFMSVLKFHFLKLELKKHNWREYIRGNNPIAAALLSKMGYREEERVQIKLEFLRMLVRMELDPARQTLLTGFFETYLPLSAGEEEQLEAAMGNLNKEEAEKMLELTTSWERKGKMEGKMEGQADILLRQLGKKFCPVPADVEAAVRKMPAEKLEQLAEAIFELESLAEVKAFLE